MFGPWLLKCAWKYFLWSRVRAVYPRISRALAVGTMEKRGLAKVTLRYTYECMISTASSLYVKFRAKRGFKPSMGSVKNHHLGFTERDSHLEQSMADYHGNYGVTSPDNGHYSDEESGNSRGGGLEMSIKEQDRFLPIANVSRIMKRALPANGKISKEAKETVQECVSEFISFVTGEASDKCKREKRKTINGDDLLWAMGTLAFEEYIEPLKVYLHRYRELEGEKSTTTGKQNEPEGGAGRASMGASYAGVTAGNSQMMPQGYGHQQINPILYSPYQQVPMQSNGGSTGGHGGGHMGGS